MSTPLTSLATDPLVCITLSVRMPTYQPLRSVALTLSVNATPLTSLATDPLVCLTLLVRMLVCITLSSHGPSSVLYF